MGIVLLLKRKTEFLYLRNEVLFFIFLIKGGLMASVTPEHCFSLESLRCRLPLLTIFDIGVSVSFL